MSKVSLGVPPRPPEGLKGGLQGGAARIDLLKDVTMMIRQFLNKINTSSFVTAMIYLYHVLTYSFISIF